MCTRRDGALAGEHQEGMHEDVLRARAVTWQPCASRAVEYKRVRVKKALYLT